MLTDTPTDLATVHARHRDIKADEVVAVENRFLEGIGAVMRDIDGVPLPTQTPGHGLSQFDLIIDNEHSHSGQRSRQIRSRIVSRTQH